jgi:NitT/TauT family transport system substrate-binding protein
MRHYQGYAALFVTVLLSLALSACGGSKEKEAAEAPAPSPPAPLKLALLPITDVLPFYLAEEKGYFTEEGLQVEAIPVSSALERDQLLQTGQVDGMLGELAAAAFFNREETRLRVVMTARKAWEGAPIFRIITPPGSKVTSPAELAGVPVAISENTIIEYITSRLLEAEGLAPDQIATRSVPAIPERFQLLMEGKIEAATLPDPLAQSAITSGAHLVVDDASHPEYAVTILAFTASALRDNPEGVRRFLKVWNRAAEEINADSDAYRTLLLQKVRVPKNVQETFSIPPFPIGEVPTEAQWSDVTAWLATKGLIDGDAPYATSVTGEFLARPQ